MDENLARRCTATAKGTGEQCARSPIPGGSVCAIHGGRAPQTVAKARARLLAGADLAIDYLLNLLEPRAPCSACGRSDADRDPVVVKACQLVMDRAGLSPSMKVEMIKQSDDALSDLSNAELADRAEQLAAEVRRMADAETQRLQTQRLSEVTDAETIESDAVVLPDDDESIEI